VDLVISCGDLHEDYLDFIVSTINKPCYYVLGNHDARSVNGRPEKYTHAGWTNLDRRVMRTSTAPRIALAGLEGCVQYTPGTLLQYTQQDQWLRALGLAPGMLVTRPDIFVAHAPPHGIHNGQDRAHAGFKALNWIMDTFRPRLLLHGHQHRSYDPLQQGETRYADTLVVNVHPYRILTLA
jgi:uncharacterized protein